MLLESTARLITFPKKYPYLSIYLYLFIIQFEISFSIKIHGKVLTNETPLLFFLIRAMVYRKKTLEKKGFLL